MRQPPWPTPAGYAVPGPARPARRTLHHSNPVAAVRIPAPGPAPPPRVLLKEFLAGANNMDEHFKNQPYQDNLPVLIGLLSVWNVSFLGYPAKAILPYCQALSKFAPHIQQVDMESNGKGVDLNGQRLPFEAGEIDFGEWQAAPFKEVSLCCSPVFVPVRACRDGRGEEGQPGGSAHEAVPCASLCRAVQAHACDAHC